MMHVRETPLAVLLMFMHVNSSLACIDKNSSILNPREFADQLLWFAKNNDVHCLSEALAATPASQQTIQFIFNNAVENDAAAVIEYLFESGYAQNAWKTTALFTAAKLCKPRAFEILLRHGADTRNTSDPIQTATHYAAISTCEASSTIIELILSRTNNQTEDKDDQGCTPLIAAADFGNVYALQTLLRHGANTEAVCQGHTALFYAVASDALNADAMVELLLDHGANVHVRNSLDVMLLTFAIAGKKKHVVEQLLRHGANINEVNIGNRTALMFAAGIGNADMFDYLIKNGADPFARDGSGLGVAHYASSLQSTESGKIIDSFLLQTNNQTEVKDVKGCTPLLVAARRSNVYAVQALLQHGALTEAMCDGNRTALFFAAMSNAENASAVAEILLQHGANLNAKDALNLTPAMVAASNGNEDMAALLQNYAAAVDYRETDNRSVFPEVARVAIPLGVGAACFMALLLAICCGRRYIQVTKEVLSIEEQLELGQRSRNRNSNCTSYASSVREDRVSIVVIAQA